MIGKLLTLREKPGYTGITQALGGMSGRLLAGLKVVDSLENVCGIHDVFHLYFFCLSGITTAMRFQSGPLLDLPIPPKKQGNNA